MRRIVHHLAISSYRLVLAVIFVSAIVGCSDSDSDSELLPGCNLVTAKERREIAHAVDSVVNKDMSVIAVREFIEDYKPLLDSYPPPLSHGTFELVGSDWISDGVTDATSRTLLLGAWNITGESNWDSSRYVRMAFTNPNKISMSLTADLYDYDSTENDRVNFKSNSGTHQSNWSMKSKGGGYGPCGYYVTTSFDMPFGSVEKKICGVDQREITILLETAGLDFKAVIKNDTATVNYNGTIRKITEVEMDQCNLFPTITETLEVNTLLKIAGVSGTYDF